MNTANQLDNPTPAPNWLEPEVARAKISKTIDDFLVEAVNFLPSDELPAPALAMQVTAGLGKTSGMLAAIANRADALLGRGHVLIYAPTLELAERAFHDFRRLNHNAPARVIRGRQAINPETLNPMCEKHELASQISGFVPSVTQSLCRSVKEDGTFVRAKCATKCPYLEQKDRRGAHVVFLSHAYLTVEPPIDREIPIALRVVDEKAWPALTSRTELTIDAFTRSPNENASPELAESMSKAKASIVDGLRRSQPIASHTRASGVSTDLLEELAEQERISRNFIEIDPTLAPMLAFSRSAKFDRKRFAASRTRERILRRIAEKETGHCNDLSLITKTVNGEEQQFVQLNRLRRISNDAPILFLDADASPEIIERIAPGSKFVSVQSQPIADVIQLSDLTLSDSWIGDEEKGPDRRTSIRKIIRRETELVDPSKVLVVSTKSVLKLFTDDAQHSEFDGAEQSDHAFLGCVSRWFGPNTQGSNDFEEFSTVIVIGRLQPRPAAIESIARAIFREDDNPVMSFTEGPLPEHRTTRLLTDGSMHDATYRQHPDRRAATILSQFREHATLQAIARLRLVSPNQPKRVIILSNLPLPGFPISRLATFEALEKGLEEEPDVPGYLKMEKALKAIADRPVCGTRLSASGLAEDLPRDFISVDAAKHFRRGRASIALSELCGRICSRNGWPVTKLSLRAPGGGKATPAIILSPRRDALTLARQFWPSFSCDLA
ncbi:hypothetical protein [Maritimibacter sp. UBA3975]|uniref:hypothetical protein n=1 Tax=Maritimibacter sp. UBA3975 TaxID=1946833 RepID=UPI000C0BAFFE|nr:hypothetical protein [Maritimibacter sp. UBA3975]MAM60459.1 hypothetical protein [Maritimibacter sp.]|tara:strand:+ start:30532 stop:32703 length:2172 start_codon:yes stop_codon:yes gene_type:complete